MSGSRGTPDPTEDPKRTRLFTVIGLVVAGVAVVLLVLVFTRHPAPQNCVALTGSQQANCQ